MCVVVIIIAKWPPFVCPFLLIFVVHIHLNFHCSLFFSFRRDRKRVTKRERERKRDIHETLAKWVSICRGKEQNAQNSKKLLNESKWDQRDNSRTNNTNINHRSSRINHTPRSNKLTNKKGKGKKNWHFSRKHTNTRTQHHIPIDFIFRILCTHTQK